MSKGGDDQDRDRAAVASAIQPPVYEPLAVLLMGNYASQSLYVAVELGITSLLQDGPLTSDELAERGGVDARTLGLVMNVLEAFGVYARDEEGRFEATPLAQLLTGPGFHPQISLLGDEYYRACGELLYSAKTGESAFAKAYGAPFYMYLEQAPESAAKFKALMEQSAAIRYADLPKAYDFSKVSRLVDVGGGSGTLTALLLDAYPDLRSVVFDSPSVIEPARSRVESDARFERCELVAGDFLEAVPPGGDAYLLAAVMSNWRDGDAGRILANCRAAMDDGARLLIVDALSVPEEGSSGLKALLALATWLTQGGWSRTRSEYESLLRGAGFAITGVRKLAFQPFALIEAEVA